MGYIPYYYDGEIQGGIVIVCVIFGLAAINRGQRRSLPATRIKRRAGIAAGCAFAGILLYNMYILQRQSVETAHHMTFGEPRQKHLAR